MELDFNTIENEARKIWAEKSVYKVVEDTSKPKYYVLDMFPYPSGAGLHVGHPLGYIASDIVARYKRLKGFNVLHPMGFDAFGLPAEQYAIQTGQHPAITTEKNIETYRKQLDKIGFSFDWSRELLTNDPKFYKWTQWIFLQLFKSWYNKTADKAEPIETLLKEFETNGNTKVNAACSEVKTFSSTEWNNFSEKEQQDILMQYRFAYLAEAYVNWCPALGTVLANDEVKDGVSERGGYPVERKLMKQWMLRITAYSERLLNGLDTIDWSDSLKEAQRNWIGKSEGCSIRFKVKSQKSKVDEDLWIEVFSTRPDTIFGATFITLAPEHELIEKITTPEYKTKMEEYVHYAKNRSERERQAEVKKVTGQFTGAYVIHPFTLQPIPVWIGEYVLAGYGTGAVMGVPGHDERDWNFANHFKLPIISILKDVDVSEKPYEEKNGILANSDFINGLTVADAIKKVIDEIEKKGIGKRKVNYKQRDAVFGRQRYWGEPIPMYYKDGIPYPVDEADLPIILPEVDKFLPTETGEPPLARAKDWKYYSAPPQPSPKGRELRQNLEQPLNEAQPKFSPLGGDLEGAGKAAPSQPSPKGKELGQNDFEGYPLETTTMPGWAGSSWYYLRYMSPNDDKEFVSPQALDYWKQIDLYVGGSEHATGHLLYFRFWTKFLKDRGWVPFEEPAKKLVNQGMIQGVSPRIFNVRINDNVFYISHGKIDFETKKVNLNGKYENVYNDVIGWARLPYYMVDQKHGELRAYKKKLFDPSINPPILFSPNGEKDFVWESDENGEYIAAGYEIEKMSKSKLNVVNPDEVIAKYGADCFRMYEMFLGPVEMSKPWDTKGIDGVSRFLRKFWRLFYDDAPPQPSPKGREQRPNLEETLNEAQRQVSPLGGDLEGALIVADEKPTEAELKILHKTIKKVSSDMENLSFNTSVSAFMICLNELAQLNCHKKEVLEKLLVMLSPFAPHICEYLWQKTGHSDSIVKATFPGYDEKLLVENTVTYPVAINGKVRANIELPADATSEQVQSHIMELEGVKKWLDGKQPKKVIVVKGKMVNVVI